MVVPYVVNYFHVNYCTMAINFHQFKPFSCNTVHFIFDYNAYAYTKYTKKEYSDKELNCNLLYNFPLITQLVSPYPWGAAN